MAQTKIKAGLFEGIIGNGTDGYFLMSNGDGTMTWSSIVINPTIDSIAYPGSVTAADPAGGETITVTGTGFKTGATVTVGGTTAPAVSYVSETQITFTTPAKAAGDYDIVVTNADTGSATYINGISYNGIPSWTTAAGSLGTFASSTTISTITLQATEPDAGTITFNITNGALPTGLSLTGANIDGTTSLETADTLYTFTVTATDDESQATPRTFTITVQKQFISTENFTINTYTGNGSTQSIEGKIGTAASFDGSSSYIVTSTLPTLTAFTLSFWMKCPDPNADRGLFHPYNGSINGTIGLFNSGTTFGFFPYDSAGSGFTSISSTDTNSLFDNNWHHVAIVSADPDDVTQAAIYVDGVSKTLTTGNSWTKSAKMAGQLYFGKRSDGYADYDGLLDQVRIFNKALSSSEITTLYGESNTSTTKSTTDIFDDGSGVALYEFEKGAIDTGGVTGYIGSGGIFNGNGFIETGINPSTFSGISLSSWVYWDGTPISNIFGGTNTGGARNSNTYWHGTDGTPSRIDYVSGGGMFYRTTNINLFNSNQWNNIIITDDNTTNSTAAKIYINGTQDTGFSVIDNNYTPTTNTNLYIGRTILNNGSTSYTTGLLDHLRVFNKVLSSSEVSSVAGETSASATKSTTDIFDDGSGVALYELEGNANDTGIIASTVDTVDVFGDSSLTDYYKLDGDLTTEKSGGTALQSGSSTFGDGILGQALYLSGAQTASRTSTSYGSMNMSSSYSISFYFKATTINKRNILWYIENIGGYTTSIELGSNNTLYFAHNGTSGAIHPSTTYSANTWYHIVMTCNTTNGSVTAYVNGQSVGSGTALSAGAGTTQCFGHGSVGLTGYIDQVRIFNRVVNASEAAELFEISQYNGTATNVSYAYDGTPTNVSFVGTSFQPDLVWLKYRNVADNNQLVDSVRGNTKYLISNGTQADITGTNRLTSFDSNGFTLGSDSIINANNGSFVAWCWKAASSDSTNTYGSITSTVRANQDAGFSIVSYDGATNSTSDTSTNGGTYWNVGHGLSEPPELVIVKCRDAAHGWYVGADALNSGDWTSNHHLVLNNTAAVATASTTAGILWGNQNPSATTFGVGGWDTVNRNGLSYIAYCFHSVDSYQKIGSFVGNGSTAGPIVTTGFKPRFVMVKGLDNISDWVMMDTVRDPIDPTTKLLYANLNSAEQDGITDRTPDLYIEVNSTGFQVKGTNDDINVNGEDYLYLAIA